MRLGLIILLFIPICSNAQLTAEIEEEIKVHFKLADQYNDIALYGEAIGELEEVITISNEHNLEKPLLDASIREAEIFRKTENFDRGILLLESLTGTEKYPLLHVRKLGRLAALYAENALLGRQVQNDSVFAFTTEGIELAVKYGFKEEEASLRNELGFKQGREGNLEEGLKNLQISAQLFKEIGDEENEVGALINTLDLHVNTGRFGTFDSLCTILLDRVEDTDWYAARSNLYRIISATVMARGDTIKAYEWQSQANGNTVSHYAKINSAQMAAFKIIHDTNLYKEDALRKSKDLEIESGKTRELYFYITILVLIVMLVALIFFRERRLKKALNNTVTDLNILNDKYQMLMVESNHRIKNNLQMIISMLEYTKKGAKNLDPRFVRNISTKIQTISALHKHLYLDVHNGLVELDAFFTEVVQHYKDIGIGYEIQQDICAAQIQGERIVYFGLILNEMLANTLEHGNSGGEKLIIEVKPFQKGYVFSYTDNSVHSEGASMGIGIRLIEQLVGRVNGADYQLDRETGKYQFYFEAD